MKVAVVGAGIAGLYTAWKLAERGQDVTVFERRGVVGKEACSGLFSERVLEYIPESKKLVQNKIDFCLLHFPKKTLKINFSKKFFVMSHYALDNLVADLARKAGVEIVLNHNVTRQGHVTLQEEYDRVIGTDGANSAVRKSFGEPEPYFRLGIQGFTNERNTDNHVDAWPTKEGFLWKIPRGEELAEGSALISPRASQKRVSVVEWGILERPTGARELFEEFLAERKIHLESLKSTLVPQGLVLPKSEKITLCGDAAGMTKPWSGGGVAWNLTGANLLLKNFPDFVKYRNEARRFFLPKIFFSKTATRIIYFLGTRTPRLLPANYKIESDFLL